MKKVLFVLNADWYFNLHWKERAIDAISKGFDVHVALPSCSEDTRLKLLKKGITVHTFSMNRTGFGIVKEVQAIVSLKYIFNLILPDVVHSVTIKPNLYCSIICRLKNIPLVSTYAGLGTLKISKKISYKVARYMIFKLIKIVSKNLSVKALFENQEDLNFFNENNFLSSDKLVRVFGAGVNLESFSYVTPQVKDNQIDVLFASRLLKDKGLIPLIDAVKLAKSNNVNVNLFVAGIFDFESPLAFSENEINSFSDRGDIIWLGKRNDVADLIVKCDVVALPTSYGEGVPRILIEACAIGRPIITTPLGGCKDICKDSLNGYLVRPNNPTDIFKALIELSNTPSLIKQFGIEGRKIVELKFSNEYIFSQNTAVYESLMKE
jgi:glycosyltransferase involved in cell wall biosynthesis